MGKVFNAFLVGIVIGLLLAPDKGSETVRKIKDWATDYKDDLEEALADGAKRSKDKSDKDHSK
jgi:gas vesicle protein